MKEERYEIAAQRSAAVCRERGNGGGIQHAGAGIVDIATSTISGNTTGQGGSGIAGYPDGARGTGGGIANGGGTVRTAATIVAGSSASVAECSGGVQARGTTWLTMPHAG